MKSDADIFRICTTSLEIGLGPQQGVDAQVNAHERYLHKSQPKIVYFRVGQDRCFGRCHNSI